MKALRAGIFLFVVNMACIISYGAPSDDDDEKTNASSSVSQAQNHEPVKRSELIPCLPTSEVHFSKLHPDVLAAIATFLPPDEMNKLAIMKLVPEHIIQLAISRITSFKIYSKQPIVETLSPLLTNGGGTYAFENARLKHLDIAQHITEQERKWINLHFPNSKIITPVTQLKKGDELYDALPTDFIALGPDNIYQIKDPEGKVPSFILSHISEQKMNQVNADSFCKKYEGRLPTKAELYALGRSMTLNEKHNSDLIANIHDKVLWSAPALQDGMFTFSIFNGKDGKIYPHKRVDFFSVICVR